MERKDGDLGVSVLSTTLNDEEGVGPTLEELHEILNDPHSRVLDGNSVDRAFSSVRTWARVSYCTMEMTMAYFKVLSN